METDAACGWTSSSVRAISPLFTQPSPYHYSCRRLFPHLDLTTHTHPTGNFLMLEEAKNLYSADATRFALADAGDTLLDANFEKDVADKACNNLFTEEQFVKEMLGMVQAGELRTGDYMQVRQGGGQGGGQGGLNLDNEMSKLIIDTNPNPYPNPSSSLTWTTKCPSSSSTPKPTTRA